jgi:hypothetical protein
MKEKVKKIKKVPFFYYCTTHRHEPNCISQLYSKEGKEAELICGNALRALCKCV